MTNKHTKNSVNLQDKSEDFVKVYKVNPTLISLGKYLRDTGNLVTINKLVETGSGVEKVTRRIDEKEDNRGFTKIFDGNISGDWTKLSLTAQRVLRFITLTLKVNEDHIFIYGGRFCKDNDISRQSLSLGLKELVEKNWLYKSDIPKRYWINLYYLCKGNVEDMWYKYQETIPV